jgi:hypothetical protein
MKKYLTAIGSNLGFLINKLIAELYGLDINTLTEVTPNEDGLIIRVYNGSLQWRKPMGLRSTHARHPEGEQGWRHAPIYFPLIQVGLT